MKITDVRTIPLLGVTPEAGWSRGTDPAMNLNTLVLVEAESGIVGVGSAFTTARLVDAALDVLRPLLIGETALEPDRLCETLLQTSYWHGRGGAVCFAVSGIDIALWDLFGKAVGQPASTLLGGRFRERVPAYASLLFADPPILRERLEKTLARGFRTVKLGWNGFGRVGRGYDELLVRTARETVGPDVQLLVDAGASEEFWPNDYRWARETERMLSGYDVTWFEEPLPPDDVTGYERLTEQASVLIATGEAFQRRQEFLPLIERRAIDIVQPDMTKCGGLSQARRIAWSAYDHGVLVVTHGWNTAVGVAADLHLAAAMPVARWVEFQTPSPYIDELLAEPFELDDDGCLAIPAGPGLGIELEWDAVARLSRG
jgi:L-alanine-DL-glutamate epimerase-like enolase superfamily enzyme